MKKVLSMIMTAALVMALFSGTAFADPGNGNGHGNGKEKFKEFKDMKGHWGSESVQEMQNRGILDGYADGTFQPDNVLTQGELAVIISRLLEVRQGSGDQNLENDEATDDEAAADDQALSDVPSWAKNAVQEGFQKHYLNLKRFHSKVQCDRLTAVVAIAKALGLEPVTDFTKNPFKDRGLISNEDYGYLLALYEAGYINGYPDGNFNPNKALSRVQIASIIDKLLNGGSTVSTDKTAPTWDSDSEVTAAAVKATNVKLEWSGAKDDRGVTGYKVTHEINGVDKVKYTTAKSATISGLESDEDYTFTVEARDAAGNWSDDGPSVKVTTLEEEIADTTAPTWTTDAALTVSAAESGVLTVVWPDATDNTGVTAYKLYNNGTLIKTLDGDVNSVNVSGLASNTEYTFKVRAVDAAGNMSSSLSETYLTE